MKRFAIKYDVDKYDILPSFYSYIDAKEAQTYSVKKNLGLVKVEIKEVN